MMTRLLREREIPLGGLILVIGLLVTLVNPAFASARNLLDILILAAPVAIIAVGVTFVVVLGEIDISVGSLMGLCAVVVGKLCAPEELGLPVPVAILAALGLGAGVGLLNGLLVTVGRVPSIIVTLGMLVALRGATDLALAGRWITGLPDGLRFLGTGSIVGVPMPILVAALVAIGGWLLATRMALGRRLYAAGSNPSAARLAGLKVDRLKVFAFTLSGTLAAVATLISVPKLSTIDAGIGTGLELLVITCVVVGGTSITGGKGTIFGTLLGVLLLGMIGNALIFLKLGNSAVYWNRAIQGALILLAVLTDHLTGFGRRGGHR